MRTIEIYSGKPLVCSECGGDDWIDEGRSLDFYNYRCSGCGHEVHPLTETGACR